MNTRNLITVVSAMILVGTEVFAVALSAAWAIGGLFELGWTVTYVLMAVFSAIGAYVMWRFFQMADRAEPIRQR